MASPYFSGPKPNGGQAGERFVTPKGPLPKAAGKPKNPVSTKPAPINTKPARVNTKPAPMKAPHYKGKHGLGVVGRVIEQGAENIVHSVSKPPKPYTFHEKGVAVHVPGSPSVAAQYAGYAGVPSMAIEHPLRWIHQQQHLSPQAKANSAIGLHVLGALAGGPAASRIEAAGAKKGLATALSGGGKKAEEKAVPEEAQVVRGAMRGAKVGRTKQEGLYSAERKARFAAASEHLNNQALAPEERIARAKGELKGELPKIHFQGFNELNPESLKALQTHILDHPHLMPAQKIRAADALTGALQGKVPTRSEITLLEHVFGKETANGLSQISVHPFRRLVLSALNIPRSLMASFDLSAPFRQGIVMSTRHPAIFAKNFAPMVKAFGSDRVYHDTLAEIRSRPSYPMMLEGKLSFTELGQQAGKREEQFQSDLAEKIPVVGHGVKASGRAYTAYLDKMRADVFDHLLQRAQSQGRNVQDEKFLKDLGRYVNSATGRGPLGTHFEGAATALNAFFFSPRLLASRMDLIFSPLTYAKADPFVRREAIRSMLQLAGTASVLLGLAAQIKGVKVVTDPRNPDWGKIRFGNTRVDIGGGFQQPLRLFAQLGTGVAISSTTGKKLNLTANGFGQPTRLDLLVRFFEGKESPIASLATDWLRNSNQVGQKFTVKSEVAQRLIPLLAQDSYDLYKAKHGGMNGLEAAFGGYALGSVGFGLQTYGPKKPAAAGPPNYFGGSSSAGSGSGYFSGSSGGSSYFP